MHPKAGPLIATLTLVGGALQLRQLALIGHGLGGMFAAELAAVQPERFSHLVLIDPFGLWLPEVPTLDYFVLPPVELAEALYHDQATPAAQATAKAPEGQEALVATCGRSRTVARASACTGSRRRR